MKKQEKKFSLLTLSACALTLASTLLCSCQQDESLYSEAPEANYTFNTTITNQDVWSISRAAQSARRKVGSRESSKLVYITYIFDSDGNAIANGGGNTTADNIAGFYPYPFYVNASAGTYKFCSVLNVASGEYPYININTTPKKVVTTDSLVRLDTLYLPNDVCLGSKELQVTASQFSYNIVIDVNHIMSKLALTVKSVPADVTSMSVTLPKQSNAFNFKGEFKGDTIKQTLTLVKATTANDDGTYNWTCNSTIVFPCATGTTEMPLTIHWEMGSTSKDVKTTSSYCCLSGKSLSLETTWNEFFTVTSLTIKDWSSTEEGSFDW